MTAEIESMIERVRGGQTLAYADVVRRYQADVWQVVAASWQVLRGPRPCMAVVDDLVQQVFVDAYLHLDQYRAGSDFGAWIKTIARNRVRQELRSRSREQQRLAVYGRLLEERLDDHAAAERHAADYREALEHCTAELTDRAARVLHQRYAESLTFEQIAVGESSTAEAIRKVLTRTLLALRDCIQARLAQA
jgi:RNA polymerase sigma-70 factor (ECF subfamily)